MAGRIHRFDDKLKRGKWAERILDAHFSASFDIEGVPLWEEKQRGIDRRFYLKGGHGMAGAVLTVEYKCDLASAKSGNLALELVSHDGPNGKGWLLKSEAQILITLAPHIRTNEGNRMTAFWFEMGRLKVACVKLGWLDKFSTLPAQNPTYQSHNLCVPFVELDQWFPDCRFTVAAKELAS